MDSIISKFDKDGDLRKNFRKLLINGEKILDQAKELKKNYNKDYYKPDDCPR